MRPALGLFVAALVTAPPPPPAAAQTDDVARRAYRQSLWGTVIPVAVGATWWAAHGLQTGSASTSPDIMFGPSLVIAGGLIVGPTLGYSAAGLGGRGWRGAGVRAGLTFLSFVPAFGVCGWNCSEGDKEADLALLIIATGTGLSLASAVYDISRVERNVRRHNERPGPSFSVAPMYVPGKRSVGISLGVTF